MVKALDGVDLSVEEGEFVAIVGKSGSRKSTLLHMLGGLDTLTEGEIIIDSKNISKMSRDEMTIFRRRKIGFVFQNYNRLDGLKPDKSFLEDILKMLGMEKKEYAMPNQLSGGQQQRVALARALAAKPAIILADEPTGNLDSCTSMDVLGLIRSSSERLGQTIVMITHDEEIAQMAGRILRLEDGKIVKEAKSENQK